MAKTLRLILGDQLNYNHSWFETANDKVTYLMAEVHEEATYTKHHIQKISGFFLAMRKFSAWLTEEGHQVIYIPLNENKHESFESLVPAIIEKHNFERFEYQFPDEYRLDEQLKQVEKNISVDSKSVDSEHFLSERGDLEAFFKGKKQYLMESFYRDMRKKHNIMMNGKEPVTGKWNYDGENRKKLPKNQSIPKPLSYKHDVTDIVTMINGEGIETIGEIHPKRFIWPANRKESLELLTFFVEKCLPDFGKFQDAMTTSDWSLFHSRLSFSMNTKMLSPIEVVERAIEEWRAREEEITIAQIEGFVRQIIGWREFMRGIYWAKMPEFASMNFFEHENPLPEWYWTGDTKMKCLSHSINQSLEYAYAHHIQRLMVTGNFALLAGVNPDELDQWYLGIYIDALEWVEITNTRGMSQFADGGIVGTKPYVSSASYMHKMSHYCSQCHYDHKKKTGENACPFNSLYWHFYHRHQDKLGKNPRIGMMYRIWEKMGSEKQNDLLNQAEKYLENMNSL